MFMPMQSIAFTKLDSEVYDEAKERESQEMNWDLTNDLLLILALNQPLMQDLRIIATYLRAVDLERLIRHARDIVRSTVLLMRMQTNCQLKLLSQF